MNLCSFPSRTHWSPVRHGRCALHEAAQRLGVPETAVLPGMCSFGDAVQLRLFEEAA